MRFNTNSQNPEQPKVFNKESAESFLKSAEKLEQLRNEIEEQKRLLKIQFQTEFNNIVRDFFIAVPTIKSVSWTQYTPYFNDGDSCEFSVNDLFFASDENDDMESWREFDEDGQFSDYLSSVKKYLSDEEYELCETLSTLINSNEDIMEDVFGDHVMVVLRADGAHDTEYDHD